jgi:hypothetical protein
MMFGVVWATRATWLRAITSLLLGGAASFVGDDSAQQGAGTATTFSSVLFHLHIHLD